MIYLATKYSDVNALTRERRFRCITQIAGRLMQRGFFVFSPITHCHPMAVFCDLPTNYDFWKGYNRRMLFVCDCMFILGDWTNSIGVKGEINIAKELDIPIIEITNHENSLPKEGEDEIEFCTKQRRLN